MSDHDERARVLADAAEQLLEHWFITGARTLSRGNAMRLKAALEAYRGTGDGAANPTPAVVVVPGSSPDVLTIKIGVKS